MAPVCVNEELYLHQQSDLSTLYTFFAYMSQGKSRKHTQAITKMMKKQSAVHLRLGHWLLLPVVNCSHTVSVPLDHIWYFECSEQQVIWNGRPEEEGTEGCFRSVHAKGNCASIQITNNTVNRIWYSTSCVTVVYIWDSSVSITAVGAMSCVRNMVGTFVQTSAVGGKYGMNDVILS